MIGLLMSVTIFEGYDTTIFHLCTPDIARTFHLNTFAVGRMASLVRLGGVSAFFLVMASDRIGRRPIVSVTVLLYTLFTLLTAISSGLRSFTLFQSLAQLFLSAEFSIAIIMVSEEFSENSRGRAIAALHFVGLIGVITGGYLYGIITVTRFGWRGMYYVGIIPLLLVAFLRRGLKETQRYQAIAASRGHGPGMTLSSAIRSLTLAIEPLRGPYRRRILLVALLWNCVGLVTSPAVTFFTLYAKRDHHWTSPQIGHAIVLAYIIGAFGQIVAGWSLDRFGRRPTTSVGYVIGAVAIFMLFRAERRVAMLTALVATVFAFQGSRSATATYSAELFPTEIRATSYSLTVQLFGQLAGLIAPALIGGLAKYFGGLGNAVAVVSVGPLIGAALVWFYAPETRGVVLENINESAAG